MLEKHDLIHELPEHREWIHELKLSNAHFAKLFAEYHEVDHEVHRIETGAETTSDELLERLVASDAQGSIKTPLPVVSFRVSESGVYLI